MIGNGNRVVQGLWIGGRLSALERLCVRSFCAHGHEFYLYHYDELRNVPRVDGLRLMNAEEILPRTAIFRHRSGSVAYFADQFRWELLRKRGGWWMDMDMVCVRPLDFAENIVLSHTDKRDRLLIGAIKFPRGHSFAALLADSYWNINRIQPWDKPSAIYHKIRRRLMFWRDSRRYIRGTDVGGGRGLMLAARHFGLEKYAVPFSVFFLPGNPLGAELVKGGGWNFDKILSAAPDLRCAHLCNSVFALHGIDKDGDYAADSLYEVLKRRYPESD